MIIILSVLIKVLFYPLTQKSMKSMRDMQKLQPKMKEIREKFKDDKERLNREVMDLYRTHKINPLMGCLPMLLQMPIWIALYATLYFAIELRQQPALYGIFQSTTSDANGEYLFEGVPAGTSPIEDDLGDSAAEPTTDVVLLDGQHHGGVFAGRVVRLVVLRLDAATFPVGLDQHLLPVARAVEDCIAIEPAQYLWSYRRFKKQPEGSPPFYDFR